MIKKLLSYAKGYGIYAFLSPLAIVFEVLIEVAIPFLKWRKVWDFLGKTVDLWRSEW